MGQFGEWRAAHGGKRRYRSRRRAWLVILRIWLRERSWDSLQPYTCRWGPSWQGGRTAAAHIHIGHGRYTPGQRAGHQFNLRVRWPLLRARSRWRRWRKSLCR